MILPKESLLVKVFTPTNYRGLNDQWLMVHEITGRRVTCRIAVEGKPVDVDFSINEVQEFK